MITEFLRRAWSRAKSIWQPEPEELQEPARPQAPANSEDRPESVSIKPEANIPSWHEQGYELQRPQPPTPSKLDPLSKEHALASFRACSDLRSEHGLDPDPLEDDCIECPVQKLCLVSIVPPQNIYVPFTAYVVAKGEIGYPASSFVARCIEFDAQCTGSTPEEAIDELNKVITSRVKGMVETNIE